MRFFISGCSPDHDSAMMTSSAVIMPRSPWLASAAWTKKAGVPVEAKVAAILRPTWPDLPRPVTISRPLALRIRSAAAANADAEIGPERGSERGHAAGLGLECAQRRLQWRRSRDRCRMISPSAVSTWSCLVPGGGAVGPAGPSLARPVRRCDARRRVLNGSLTIIVLTPLTTFSTGALARLELDRQAYDFVGVFSS